MSFQQTIYASSGLGVPGEAYDNSPVRAQPFIIDSEDAANNVVARAVSITEEGKVTAGNPEGTNIFAGIIVNPKAYALYGDVGSPTLTLPNDIAVEVANMGSFIVTLPAAANIGDLVVYDNDTGVLETIAPGAALPVGKSFAYAVVDRFTVTVAGLAVATFTKVSELPVPAETFNYTNREGDNYVDREGNNYVGRSESLTKAQQKVNAKAAEKALKDAEAAAAQLDGETDQNKGAK